jgi:phage terminase large subunit GpA-like protein
VLHFNPNPQPLPPFRRAYDIIAKAGALLRPRGTLTVSEWAERYAGHDFAAAPWQAEVMDALGDPETAVVGLMGPVQIGKSEIGNCWIGHSVDQDPGDFLYCQSTKDLADDYSKRRISRFVERLPRLKDALLPGAGSDNVHMKQFRGMILSIIWPVAGQFTARPIRKGWLDDIDQYPDDIDGQGDAVGLLSGRQSSFEGRDTKFVSSNPAKGEDKGIEAFVASRTDERLTPECPHCGDRIEVNTLRDLKYDGETAEQAAASAYVTCPANGCVLLPDDKFAMMRSLATLPNRGFIAKHGERGKRERSFRVDGLLCFRSWGEMARMLFEARASWATRQDEGPLCTYANTAAGQNYRSIYAGEKPLTANELERLRVPGWKMGTVPRGPVVITLAVDVQFDRFECVAKGWADGMESWTIDRWAVDVLEDGLTALDPFRKPEHWRVLLPLFDKTWPLAGAGGARSPKPLTVAIDTGGGGDKETSTASENANKFWHLAVANGVHPTRVTLVKGSSRREGDLIGRARRADQKTRGGAKRNSPALWLVNVHRAKFILDARMRRIEPGPGRLHYPQDFDPRWFDEMTAEELVKGKWEKLRPRNEQLDLELYAWLALLKPPFAQSRSTMRWVPADFRIVWPELPVGAESENEPITQPPPIPAMVQKQKSPRLAPVRRRQGWMGRLK